MRKLPPFLLLCCRPDCNVRAYQPLFAGTMGTMDFAGSGVVHMVRGPAGFLLSVIHASRARNMAPVAAAGCLENCCPSLAAAAVGERVAWGSASVLRCLAL